MPFLGSCNPLKNDTAPLKDNDFSLRLVDPREIQSIFVFYSANEPGIKGFLNLESYILSMFASINPRVYIPLSQRVRMPELQAKCLQESHNTKELQAEVVKIVSSVFKEFEAKGEPIRLFLQYRDIPKLPTGTTGPAHICLFILCRETRGRKSLIIPSDLELLPES
jgi:hypothetical protein